METHLKNRLENLLKETGCQNHELTYLFCDWLILGDEYEKAEKYIKKLKRLCPRDEGVKRLLDDINRPIELFGDEELSLWDMMEGKKPKSSVETYRRTQPKIGRNDPCPCRSGKKYKKCCGK